MIEDLTDKERREIRAKSVELAGTFQTNVISALIPGVIAGKGNITGLVDTFVMADRIYNYIVDGTHHPDGLISIK